jgi:hypothetical protein
MIKKQGSSTEITVGDTTLLYSYNTIVGVRWPGHAYHTTEKHSVTTSRHVNRWIAGSESEGVTQERLEMIASDLGLAVQMITVHGAIQ